MAEPLTAEQQERLDCARPDNEPDGDATVCLVAPSQPDDYNVIAPWVEVQVVTDRGAPIAFERCVLYLADGQSIEDTTDESGLVLFNVPYPDVDGNCNSTLLAFQIPDILEEWVEDAPGVLKHSVDANRDAFVHFVPLGQRTVLKIDQLSQEQKFQYFQDAYVGNGAVYIAATHRNFRTRAGAIANKKKKKKMTNDEPPRWEWGGGAVCNQHVNFFLGYWLNYNDEFMSQGSSTEMLCLTTLNASASNKYKGTRHRGYREFLEIITGFGDYTYDFRGDNVEYIRVSRYFNQDGTPKAGAANLIAALNDFNVYSLADITWTKGTAEKRKKATEDVKKWLSKHKDSKTLTDKDIKKMDKDAVWDLVWDLDSEDETDREILQALRKYLNTDHHAGLLLRRSAGGGPPVEPYELWKSTADGHRSGKTKSGYSETPIVLEPFAEMVAAKRHKDSFLHLAVWAVKDLRRCGYAPSDGEDNAGGISIDNPRFIPLIT